MKNEVVPDGLNRRQFIKSTAAAGAALSAGSLAAPAVHAATPTIKVGYVTPSTGPLAGFAEADGFNIDAFKTMMKDGLKLGGKTYAIDIQVRDSQSNPNRASQVAKDLITKDQINLMIVQSTPETSVPVATQCEIEEIPCIASGDAVAAVLLRPAEQPRRSAALQIHVRLLLGHRRRHRGLHQHVGPACHQQAGGRAIPERRRRQCLG